ncbi:hypothetical protein PM082_018901 [Marasmius tenuissimus]|nr:hypothetical protein PM082_018901 [Marasmius tenuissimus]
MQTVTNTTIPVAQAPPSNNQQLNAVDGVLSRIVEEHGPLTGGPVVTHDPTDPTRMKLSDEFINLFCNTCQRLDEAGLLVPIPNVDKSQPQAPSPPPTPAWSYASPDSNQSPRAASNLSSQAQDNPYSTLLIPTASEVPSVGATWNARYPTHTFQSGYDSFFAGFKRAHSSIS